MKLSPFLLVIQAGHLLFVGGCLLYGGLTGMGMLALMVSVALSLRAKREWRLSNAEWEEEVQAMSAGEMMSFEEEVDALIRERIDHPVLGSRVAHAAKGGEL